jgi:hypothetical protein
MSSRHGHNKLRVAAAFFVGSVAIAPGALSEVIRQRSGFITVVTKIG